MKTLKEILLGVAGPIAICLFFVPFVYWALHSELTQMQVFLKFWWVSILAIVIVVTLFIIPENEDTN